MVRTDSGTDLFVVDLDCICTSVQLVVYDPSEGCSVQWSYTYARVPVKCYVNLASACRRVTCGCRWAFCEEVVFLSPFS